MNSLAVLPVEAEQQISWYHGTGGDDVIAAIVRDGYLRPVPRDYANPDIAPVAGHVYLSRDPVFALAFGLIRQPTHPKRFPVYILEVEGRNLRDVEPDEDLIGSLVLAAKHPPLNALAFDKMHWYGPLPVLQVQLRLLWKSPAALGKFLLPLLDPNERRMFLNMPEVRNITHVGPVPVSSGQRVLVTKNRQLADAFHQLLAQNRWNLFREWALPLLKKAERIF